MVVHFFLICHTFQNFQSRVQNENPIRCGPLSSVTQKAKNDCKTWNASTIILTSKNLRFISNSSQIRSGTLVTCESYLT
jgi:hypothetical protein